MIQLASALVLASSAARAGGPRTLVVDGSPFAYGGAGPRGAGPDAGCAGDRALECALRPLSSCEMADVAAAAATPTADGAPPRFVERSALAPPLPADGGPRPPTPLLPLPGGATPWQWFAAHRGLLHFGMADAAAAAVADTLAGIDDGGAGAWPAACAPPLIGVNLRHGDGAVGGDGRVENARNHARLVVRAGAATGGRRVLVACDADDAGAVAELEREVARAAAAAAAAPLAPFCARAVPRRFAVPREHAGESVAAFLSSDAGRPHRWNATVDVLAAVEALSNAGVLVGFVKSQLSLWIASVSAAKGCSLPGHELWSVAGDAGGGGPVPTDELARRNWADSFDWGEAAGSGRGDSAAA